MADTQDSLDTFIQRLASTRDLWRSMDVRVLAIEGESACHNLATRIRLDHRRPESVDRFGPLPAVASLFVTQSVEPPGRLEEVCTSVVEGAAEIDGTKVSYVDRPGDGGRKKRLYRPRYYFDGRGGVNRMYSGSSSHVFAGSGDDLGSVLRRASRPERDVNHQLRTNDSPYDGLDGLIGEFVCPRGGRRRHRKAFFDVIAPLGVRLNKDETHLEDETLSISVIAENERALEMSSPGIFAARGEGENPTAEYLDYSERHRIRNGPRYRARTTTELTGARSVRVFLRLDGFCVDQTNLQGFHSRGHNIRASAYSVFDPRFEDLKNNLFPESTEAGSRFERAVVRLLTLCGFGVDDLASAPKRTDAVDALAYDRFGEIAFACEVTGGGFSNDKLTKLLQRVADLERQVAGIEFKPVIVSALSRDYLADSPEKEAGRQGVIVLTRSELKELFDEAVAGADHAELLERIQSLVPATDDNDGHHGGSSPGAFGIT